MDILTLIIASTLTLTAPSEASVSGSEALSLLEFSYLQSEVNLASRPQFYLVVNIPDRIVRIKARGRVFKEWPIRALRSWGETLSPLPQAVKEKDSLVNPKRPEIKAVIPSPQSASQAASGQTEPLDEAPFQLEALELPDMPTSYTLTLDSGLSVTVHPSRMPASGAIWAKASSYVGRIIDALLWNASISIRYMRSDRKPRLDMAVDPVAAQEMYWHVPAGTQVLVIGKP